jgi:hypothetical protein
MKTEGEKPHIDLGRAFLGIFGVLATIVSCYFTVMLSLNREVIAFVVPFLPSPTPRIIYVTVPVTPFPIDTSEPTTPTLRSYSKYTASPTHTPYPPNPTYTPYPTYTAYPPNPTYTPYPKPALSPTAEPISESRLFEDDFDAGLRPEWEIVQGTWGTASGQFTLIDVSERPTIGMALVGDTSWDNYVVEFDVTGLYDSRWASDEGAADYDSSDMNETSFGDYAYSRAAVLVGIDKEGSGVGLIIGQSFMMWGIFKEDLWNVVSGTLVQAYGEQGTHLRVTVQGNIYEVYSDKDKMLTSFSVPGRKGGRVGIWLKALNGLSASDWRTVPKIDNFSVTPLD